MTELNYDLRGFAQVTLPRPLPRICCKLAARGWLDGRDRAQSGGSWLGPLISGCPANLRVFLERRLPVIAFRVRTGVGLVIGLLIPFAHWVQTGMGL